MHIVYESELFGLKNSHSYFEVDECLFSHKNGQKIWILGPLIHRLKNLG